MKNIKCPYCKCDLYDPIHVGYNCVRSSDHFCFYCDKEFYLIVDNKYKIGMHFRGPTYYFSASSDSYKTKIIPPFEFDDMKNVLDRMINLLAFL